MFDWIFLLQFFRSEEAMVMANLRKRVAACDLERRPVIKTDDADEQTDINRPLLSNVS